MADKTPAQMRQDLAKTRQELRDQIRKEQERRTPQQVRDSIQDRRGK
jgi:hypothetical protein